MASKRTKASPTADDELDELFEGITDDSAPKKSVKSKSSAAKGKPDATEQDILAELENELGDKPPPRPHTPRVRDATIKRTSTNTPPPAAAAAAAADAPNPNVPRKSADSTRSYHASFTPSATSSELQESERKVEQPAQTSGGGGGGGGGWWGGILSTATAAIKQAEATVKELQQNEEAKKWADQVRGINVGAIRGLGTFQPMLSFPPVHSHTQEHDANVLRFSHRRRTPPSSPSNLFHHPQYPRPPNLLPRAPSHPHNPRPGRIPLP